MRHPAAASNQQHHLQQPSPPAAANRRLRTMVSTQTMLSTQPAKQHVPDNAPPTCPGTNSDSAGKSTACVGCPNQNACASGTTSNQAEQDALAIARRLKHLIRHKILVLSGKGGVGKSTISAQLALCLAAQGLQVGLLDVDVCGPSIPHMLGVAAEEVRMSASGWSPVYVEENLALMSIGFMLSNRDDAVIWRGPRKTGLIKQFLRDVDWGELDYLIIDSPPGTSDEHISLVQMMKQCDVDGAVIVTTPQEVSLLDVRKEINFCRKSETPVLGVVENMAGFVCEHCEHCTDIFFPSSGGALNMCKDMHVQYLGKIPLDPAVSMASEMGKSVFEDGQSAGVKALKRMVEKIKCTVGDGGGDREGDGETDGSVTK